MAQRKRTPSSLDRQVGPERLAELAKTIASGSVTYRELQDILKAEGVDVSASALKRFGANAVRAHQDLLKARELCSVIVSEFGDDADGDVSRVLSESVSALVLRSVQAAADNEEPDVVEVQRLAKAALDAGRARSVANIDEIKRREWNAGRQAAVAELEASGKSEGLSSGTIEAIKARILGVRKEASP